MLHDQQQEMFRIVSSLLNYDLLYGAFDQNCFLSKVPLIEIFFNAKALIFLDYNSRVIKNGDLQS